MPSRGVTSTAGRSGGSHASMMRRASWQAKTSSTARTTMLLNGLRQTVPSPASLAASCATGGSRSKLRL